MESLNCRQSLGLVHAVIPSLERVCVRACFVFSDLLTRAREPPCCNLLDTNNLIAAHDEKYISISFRIECSRIVVTVFLSILNPMEFHLVFNQKENCLHDQILSNLKAIRNVCLRVPTQWNILPKWPFLIGWSRHLPVAAG